MHILTRTYTHTCPKHCHRTQILKGKYADTPAGQKVQGPPTGPVDPAPQFSLQTLGATDPGGDVNPTERESSTGEYAFCV